MENKIKTVSQNGATGYIESIELEGGAKIDGDLFVDCTGFRGLLIEQTLKTVESWSSGCHVNHSGPNRRTSGTYTRSIAREAGWQWRIPLQHRVGNGLVFSSDHWSDDEATNVLLGNIEGKVRTEPRVIKFHSGTRRQHWNKNCVALGLASGFLEPLESTSIHLIQKGIIRLLQMFPSDGIRAPDVEEFNQQMRQEIEHTRDFIILHYHVNQKAGFRFLDKVPRNDCSPFSSASN